MGSFLILNNLLQHQAGITESCFTTTFLKIQVSPSDLWRPVSGVTKGGYMIPFLLVVLSSLSIHIGGEAFASIEIPNMTSTEPQSGNLSTERLRKVYAHTV